MSPKSMEREILRLRAELEALKRRPVNVPVRFSTGGGSSTPGEMILVRVEKDGGDQGTKTTPASYTYKVRSYSWPGSGDESFTLSNNTPLARPRPNGRVTYQSGSMGLGLAFYDGEELTLWDAGEIPLTNPCA